MCLTVQGAFSFNGAQRSSIRIVAVLRPQFSQFRPKFIIVAFFWIINVPAIIFYTLLAVCYLLNHTQIHLSQ